MLKTRLNVDRLEIAIRTANSTLRELRIYKCIFCLGRIIPNTDVLFAAIAFFRLPRFPRKGLKGRPPSHLAGYLSEG